MDLEQPLLDLYFPSLLTSDKISLNGSFARLAASSPFTIFMLILQIRINMPLLNDIGYAEGGSYFFPGLTINHAGNPLTVDFPSLTGTNKLINMTGKFTRFQNYCSLISSLANTSSVSLPLLKTSRGIKIQSYRPLDVNFPALEDALFIELLGEISSLVITPLFYCRYMLSSNTVSIRAAFPVLEKANSIVLNTTLPIDCGAFNSATERAKANPHDDGAPKGPYFCPGSEKKGLSTGAKVGIAVGVVVGVLALAAIAWWFVKRK